jgi:hypothetical protein
MPPPATTIRRPSASSMPRIGAVGALLHVAAGPANAAAAIHGFHKRGPKMSLHPVERMRGRTGPFYRRRTMANQSEKSLPSGQGSGPVRVPTPGRLGRSPDRVTAPITNGDNNPDPTLASARRKRHGYTISIGKFDWHC